MRIKVISESTTEPITVAQAVLNARAYDNVEAQAGSTIPRLITTARRLCEEYLDMSLVQKTLEIATSYFHRYGIELPRGPVREIVSVTYVNDADGVDTVLATDQYRINVYTLPTLLQRAYNVDWPTGVRSDLESVRVRYTAGYPSTDSPVEVVPEPIIQAMHLYIKHYFDNRSAIDGGDLMELPLGARHLLNPYRQGLGV